MMRVYLFADFGRGAQVVHRYPNAQPIRAAQARARGQAATLRGIRARAWWLVECESAEHGRALIEANGRPVHVPRAPASGEHPWGPNARPAIPAGRILDSGRAA